MPITDKQRARRGGHIGSSDVPAIMGESPWKTAHDLWLEKTGRAESFAGNIATEAGHYFEDAIIRWYEKVHSPVVRNQYRVYKPAYLGSHIDALVQGQPLPVEVKTAGLFGPLSGDWGEAGTDQVPNHVILQAHAHMICLAPMTPEMCHVAAFLGGRGFMLFEIPFNSDLAEAIKNRCIDFWEHNVIADTPPDSSIPTMDVIKRIKRLPDKVVTIDRQLVIDYEAARSALSSAKKDEELRKSQLIFALGNAESGECDGYMVSYMERKRKAYQVAESSFRQLSIKEIK